MYATGRSGKPLFNIGIFVMDLSSQKLLQFCF